jgi:hypothetical protein
MDSVTLTVFVFLYLVCLPICLMFATMAVEALGLLRRRALQPVGMRIFTWMWTEHSATISLNGLFVSIVGLALTNVVPVGSLVFPKNGWGVYVLVLGYWVIVALWVIDVALALRRAKGKINSTS